MNASDGDKMDSEPGITDTGSDVLTSTDETWVSKRGSSQYQAAINVLSLDIFRSIADRFNRSLNWL